VNPDGGRFDTCLGAVIAVVDNLLIISLLLARVAGRAKLEYWLGAILLTSILPLGYLFLSSFRHERQVIYLIWIGLMLAYLLIELLLGYVLKYDFRSVRWMAIAYVILFFGATGGMIGVASRAGRLWMLAAVTTFIVMFFVAFYQHYKTGM
jgi:hypothetical protein